MSAPRPEIGGVDSLMDTDTSQAVAPADITMAELAVVDDQATSEFKVDRLRKLLGRVFGLQAENVPNEVTDCLNAFTCKVFFDEDLLSDLSDELCLLLVGQQSAVTAPKYITFNKIQLHFIFPTESSVMKELGRLVGSSVDRVFKYLVACYINTRMEHNNNWMEPFETASLPVITQSILRTAILFLQGALTQGNNRNNLGCLLSRLVLSDPGQPDFIRELIMQADVTGDLVQVLSPVFNCLTRCLGCCSLSSDSKDYMIPYEIMKRLMDIKYNEKPIRRPVCTALTAHPDFHVSPITAAAGREVATGGILGPFIALSVLNEDANSESVKKFLPYDDMPTEATRQMTYNNIQDRMHGIRRYSTDMVKYCVANTASRPATLKWLAQIISTNWKRAQMQADMSKLTPDGYMLNLMSVLYDLAAPIPLDKIDLWYAFSAQSYVALGEESRLKMSLEEANAYVLQIAPTLATEHKFTTECFFISVHAQHIAMMPALNRLKTKRRQIGECDRELAKLDRLLADASSVDKPRIERKIEHLKKHTRVRLVREVGCAEALLLDPTLISTALMFCGKQLSALIKIIEPNFSASSVSLPEHPPKHFAALPEFYLEDILDLLLYYIRYSPESLMEPVTRQASELLLPQVLVFIINPQYFTNPFLASKSIELLYCCAPDIGGQRTAQLFNSVINCPLALDRMYPSLVKFYSSVESTGAHNEFYDKFSIRHHIQVIFGRLYEHASHNTTMLQVANRCDEHFVRFINMILNDTTFMLDESLEALKRIHEVELLINDKAQWDVLPAEEQRAKREQLAQDQGSVRSWLPHIANTLTMLGYMTKLATQPFLNQVLGERLATMLNYNLAQLVGPKSTTLTVSEPDKYRWNPRELVQMLVEVYLALAGDTMAKYIAMDERTFNKEMFDSILARMTRNKIVPYRQIELLANLFAQAFEIWKENQQADEDFGDDIPDEFLDEIMGSLMDDPVRLPSGYKCDRTVIERHLLSDQTDPFTRNALTNADLVPEPELKQRITEWKAMKRSSRSAP